MPGTSSPSRSIRQRCGTSARAPNCWHIRVSAEIFTDHMVTISGTRAGGWHDAQLRPYGPFSMDPASAVLHYGQEIFEGLKAYRQVGGAVATFRPTANAARFNRSAARMAMPELPEDAFVQALELLVDPGPGLGAGRSAPGSDESLYLRPFMIATQLGLGVSRPSASYMFAVIASPAGDLFLRAAASPSPSGSPTPTPGQRPAAPARPRPAATTRARSPASSRHWRTAATRWSGWMRSSTSGSRRWAA